jgi:predicted nucleotidyltransferase
MTATEEPAMRILLSGVVGSAAYGLAGPDSDIDRLGVFTWPTALMFGLTPPNDSICTTKPDVTYHEAAKACRLMLGGNPTASEILWLESHETKTPLGDELIGIRNAFLSAKRTRDAYLGYATQQFRKLLSRDGKSFGSDIPQRRTAKHARHLMRLCDQGYELYTTGHLRIRLEDPQRYLDFGEQVAADPQSVIPFMAAAEQRFNDARTVLPDEPRVAVVEGWLHRVRRAYYESDGEAR